MQTVNWLWDLLAHGPVASVEVFKKADAELSVSERAVKRARNVLGDAISVYRESTDNVGGGQWVWKRSASVPPPPGTLANLETGTLTKTVIPQGLSAPEGAQEAQGGQYNGVGTLANSDAPEPAGLFEDF